MLLRGTAAAIVVGVLVAGGASTWRKRNDAPKTTPKPQATVAQVPTSLPAKPSPTTDSAMGVLAATTPAVTPAVAPVARDSVAPGVAHASVAPFDPLVPVGESTLLNGITATRSDTAVVVSFDLAGMRTRQPKRFEQMVRQTLGAIYGTPGVESLDRIPVGGIASQGSLLTELPKRGAAIPTRPGWVIRVFPELKTGRDGPLVVRYRAVLVPASE